MRLIDADALGNRMYHESFEKDSDLQKWDSGCWIRYKLFEQVLRAAPTIDLTHPTSSNTLGALDCVDRAEVIKAVKFYETFCDPYPRVIEALEELPSVQPEIIRCKDCKWCSEHYDTDGNVPYWVCINWDAGTDADGFCHEAELRGEQDG